MYFCSLTPKVLGEPLVLSLFADLDLGADVSITSVLGHRPIDGPVSVHF